MSRSYRKTPIFTHVHKSGRKYSRALGEYKCLIHGTERARVRTAIAHGDWDALETVLCPWNDWDAPGDGKFYYANPSTPQCGWGVHNPETSSWSKEILIRSFEKSMRK